MLSPVMGKTGCPGREPDYLKPAGTWVGVRARMYNDSNSLGDRVKEGRGSEHRHAGIYVATKVCPISSFPFIFKVTGVYRPALS